VFRRKRQSGADVCRVDHDPLAAVPLVPEGVTATATPDGGLELCRDLRPKNRLHGWIARTLRWDLSVRVRLDATGAVFWSCVDGRRTVREVAEVLAGRLQARPDAARQAVVQYIGTLMRKGWIQLRLAIPPRPASPDAR
jgi:hypothetical protein